MWNLCIPFQPFPLLCIHREKWVVIIIIGGNPNDMQPNTLNPGIFYIVLWAQYRIIVSLLGSSTYREIEEEQEENVDPKIPVRLGMWASENIHDLD